MEDRVELEHRLTKVEEACAMIPDMSRKLDSMDLKLSRYDGRWGTITLIGTAMWAMLIAFKDNILGWFKN